MYIKNNIDFYNLKEKKIDKYLKIINFSSINNSYFNNKMKQ